MKERRRKKRDSAFDFQDWAFLIRKLHRGPMHASLIHSRSNELMNYEFSGGNNGFVC